MLLASLSLVYFVFDVLPISNDKSCLNNYLR